MNVSWTMLGVGNGFSRDILNNNALIEYNGKRVLIDCGITAMESLNKLGLDFSDIDGIFITHLHFDHSGGLEAAALFTQFIKHKRIKLFIPEPIYHILWENVLSGCLNNPSVGLTKLEDFFDVFIIKEYESFFIIDELQASWIRTEHIKEKFSCSLVIGRKLFYSSDMICNEKLLIELYQSGITLFFHDCILHESHTHAYIENIYKYPKEILNKMYLMHHGVKYTDKLLLKHDVKLLEQHKKMTIDF